MPIRVQTPQGIVEFPDGTDPQVMESALREQFPMTPAVSHDSDLEARPIATGGGRGTGLDVRKSDAWLKQNAPAIGAGIATASGGSLLPMTLAAGGGGFLGAKLRGDETGDAAMQGLKEAGTQLIGTGVVNVGGKVARGLMQGAVPKNIAKEFAGQVDIPQEMLDRNVVPGMPSSARRVSALSTAANAEREAAAQTVPVMPRRKILAELRPSHTEAVMGKKPQMAQTVTEHMRTSAREIGPNGLTGPEALARKDIEQRMGSAALNNPQTAAIAPQLHDAERAAIVKHLRETPRMEKALNESQTLMAIDRVMKDAALSNPVTRGRIGGLTAASLSPAGMGLTAHLVKKGANAVSPQMLRAIQLALLQGNPDEQ